MMEIPDVLLVAFPPSSDLLLNRVRLHIDDAMLMKIAEADYGWKAKEIMAELRPIRDTGVIPDEWSWNLGEVLTLVQFSDPEALAADLENGPNGRHYGYLVLLFACAVLLRAESEQPLGEFDARLLGITLARCLDNAKVLGEEMSEAAACFLTWRLSRQDSDYGTLVFVIGLLVLATRLRSRRFTEQSLGTIAMWVIEQEPLDRREFPQNPTSRWPSSVCFKPELWENLADELNTDTEDIRDDEVRTNLQLCALILEDP